MGVRIDPGDTFECSERDALNYMRRGLASPVTYETKVVLPAAPADQPTVPWRPPCPVVSAIMPTKDRPEFVRRAVDCFLSQDFDSRELVIVDDGAPVANVIPRDPRIRYFRYSGNPAVGAKRNFACQAAHGEVIIHWDDDDWSAPARITEQLRHLRESGAQVCGISEMLFWDIPQGRAWKYSGSRGYLLGTSMIYRKEFWENHRFPSLQIGEDNGFQGGVRTAALANLGLIVARTHEGNTSKRDHRGKNWKRVESELIPAGFFA